MAKRYNIIEEVAVLGLDYSNKSKVKEFTDKIEALCKEYEVPFTYETVSIETKEKLIDEKVFESWVQEQFTEEVGKIFKGVDDRL